MRKSYLPIIVFFSIVFITACSTSQKETKNSEILQMENELFSHTDATKNRQKAVDIIDAYIEYADLFPEDSASPEYLFKAAEISMNIQRSQAAISIYDRIILNYPTYRKTPECLFLKGFVYENNLGDLNKAESIYKEFLKRYPDNDFADDAQISLNNLGKTPEELIKEFEERQSQEN